jgi:hypothetical protein
VHQIKAKKKITAENKKVGKKKKNSKTPTQ